MKRYIFLMLYSLSAVFLSACGEKNNQVVLRVGHTLDTKHSVHKALEHMAERLNVYSNGSMEIKLYPSGQLGSERQMVELLQIGSLAMTKVSAATLEGFADDMRVFGVPYVFQSKDHLWQVLGGDVGNEILSSITASHLVGLGYMDAGSRSFYVCDKSVNTPADVVGKKIRVMNSQNAVKMVGAYGGAATPLSWGELYAALQQGVVDGAENNPPSFHLSRHYEVCKFYSINEHTSIPDVVVASKHIYDSLTEQQKVWLNQAMADAVVKQKQLWHAAEEFALSEVTKAGVVVTYPDKAPFIEAVKPIHAQYKGSKIGQYIERIGAMAGDK